MKAARPPMSKMQLAASGAVVPSRPPILAAMSRAAIVAEMPNIDVMVLNTTGTRQQVVPPAGIEPATHGLGNDVKRILARPDS